MTKPTPIDPDSKSCLYQWGHHGEHECVEHIVSWDEDNAENSYVTHFCDCGAERDTDMEGNE